MRDRVEGPPVRPAVVPADGDRRVTPAPLLITSDEALRDEALTAVAAAGAEVMVVSDVAAGLPSWRAASMVLIGVDAADGLRDRRPGPVRPLHILGDRHDHEELCLLSAELGATVAVLPDQRGSLADSIRERSVGPDRGQVVAVHGAGGGLGASTTAAGLAWRAHRRQTPTLLMDLDPYGGGLDLVLGVESEPGWRWPQLAEVSGGVSDLAERLPRCEGLPVLSGSRERPARPPTAVAVGEVLASARAEHALVVVDLGRGLDVDADAAVRHRAAAVLLLVRDDVRGVAAAAGLLADDPATAWRVVLRRGPGGEGLPADAVADTLGREVVATAPYDRSLPTAALRGTLPGPGARRAWRRHLDRLLAVSRTDPVGRVDDGTWS